MAKEVDWEARIRLKEEVASGSKDATAKRKRMIREGALVPIVVSVNSPAFDRPIYFMADLWPEGVQSIEWRSYPACEKEGDIRTICGVVQLGLEQLMSGREKIPLPQSSRGRTFSLFQASDLATKHTLEPSGAHQASTGTSRRVPATSPRGPGIRTQSFTAPSLRRGDEGRRLRMTLKWAEYDDPFGPLRPDETLDSLRALARNRGSVILRNPKGAPEAYPPLTLWFRTQYERVFGTEFPLRQPPEDIAAKLRF